MIVRNPSNVATTPVLSTVERCAPGRKLYLPYSAMCMDKGKIGASRAYLRTVNIHWFIVGRAEPISPYEIIIQRYTSLNGLVRTRAEAIVDEFFREDEFRQLEEYMQKRRYELRTSMQLTPVESVRPDDSTRVGTLRPFALRTDPRQQQLSICHLSDEEGYSLPFTVWGAYIE